MSNVHFIGIASAIFIAASAFFFSHVTRTNAVGAQVATGFLEGIPLEPAARRVLLYQGWVPSWVGLWAFPLAVGVAMLQIARSSSDADASMVAYLYTFLLFVSFLGSFLTGAATFFQYAGRVAAEEAEESKRRGTRN